MIQVLSDKRTHENLRFTATRIPVEFRRGIRRGLHEVGDDNKKFLRKLLNQPGKHGRWYFIHGKWHRASAPYEAPAKLTGNLLRSTDYRVRGSKSVEIGDQKLYGKFLELGTVKMQPRPHLKTMERFKRRSNLRSLTTNVYDRINR